MENLNGIIIKNVANIHAEKDTGSELVTQTIMGQLVKIEKDEGDWLYIQTWDTYHGWILSRWVSREIPRPRYIATVTSLFTDAYLAHTLPSEIWTKLVITTTLELLEPEDELVRVKLPGKDTWALEFAPQQRNMANVRLPDGNEAWVSSKDIKIKPAGDQELPLPPNGQDLVQTAKRFLGVPYLWGGSSPFGIDCSGFMQLSYKLNGMGLLRDAGIQASDPHAIPVEKDELRAGDLVFFAGGEDKTKITHVGMACRDGKFIHSAGMGRGVTINNLSDEPYDRNYWGARRMPGM